MILNFVIQISLTTLIALTFIFLLENIGFFLGYLVKKFTKQFDKESLEIKENENLSLVENIALGMLLLAMTFFVLGVLNLFIWWLLMLLPIICALVIFLKFQRWKGYTLAFRNLLKANRWILLGTFSSFLFIAPLLLRPALGFDAKWYHLTIPKLFLEAGNIDYLGIQTRYSVHPYLNFFWNSWFQANPWIELGLESMAINIFQGLVLILSGGWVSMELSKRFNFHFITSFFAPFVLIIPSSAWSWYGEGYNDLYGLMFGLLIGNYLIKLNSQNRVSWTEFIYAILLIASIGLLKIFFSIFAVIAFCTLLFIAYPRLSAQNHKEKIIRIIIIIGFFGIFLGLPWVIRSYLFTGRLLDPVGAPGLSEDAYNFEGSMNAKNHWEKHLFERWEKGFWDLHFIAYSPLFTLGYLAIFKSKKNQENLQNIWFLGFFGFWVVYVASIVFSYRYLFGGSAILVILGLIYFNRFIKEQLNALIFISSILFFVGYIGYSGLLTYLFRHPYKSLYAYEVLRNNKSLDNYLEERIGIHTNLDYYASENTPVPEGFSKDSKLFLIFLHNFGYIENPVLENRTHFKKFEKLKSVQDLKNLLKEEEVDFILAKNLKIENFCKDKLKLEDCENLEKEGFKEILYEPKQNAIWYKFE